MKVILTKDVKDTGRAHETVEVKDGHGLNFLIPKGMAVLATPSNMKATETRRKQADDRRALDSKLVSERLSALAEEKLTITKKANEKGHLYDAVDAAEIAAAAKIPEDAVRLDKPLKELGTFTIPVMFGKDFGSFPLTISAE